ncbi:MAG: cyclic nucleotide-binding domain-containing protein [Acidobacteria bacterium]|nr:cyclic nucleotide-binding domain-containing protein [Acidobacteriota bacterium]
MEIQSLEKVIAEHEFFSDLESYYTALLVSCASNVRFEAGKYLWREGEEANAFYLIREGRIAVEINPPQRKPIIVDTVGEGDVLGWSWLLPPYVWKFSARAVDGTRAVALDGKCLRNKCEQNHDLGYEMLKRFSQIMNRRLDATRIQLLDLYATR